MSFSDKFNNNNNTNNTNNDNTTNNPPEGETRRRSNVRRDRRSPLPPLFEFEMRDGAVQMGGGQFEEWGLDILDDLNLDPPENDNQVQPVPPQPLPPQPLPVQPLQPSRQRSDKRNNRNVGIDLLQIDPEVMECMDPKVFGGAYQKSGGNERSTLFVKLTHAPKVLGKVVMIAEPPECQDLLDRVMRRQNPRLVQQMLTGAFTMDNKGDSTETLIKDIIGKFGDQRNGLCKVGRLCAKQMVLDANSSGTVGRGNNADSKLITQMGNSGPSKDWVDGVVGDSIKGLFELNPPKGATLDPSSVPGNNSNEKNVVVLHTAKLVGEMMQEVLDRLNKLPVPPELTMISVTLFQEGSRKFDETESRRLIGGHLLLRLLMPTLSGAPRKMTPPPTKDQCQIAVLASRALQNIANGHGVMGVGKHQFMLILEPWVGKVEDAISGFTDRVIKSGSLHCKIADEMPGVDVTDPRDIITTALGNPNLLTLLFAAPGENDPLGTDPSDPISPVGKAIAKAAATRDRQYDFKSASKLNEFADMVLEERREVLEKALDFL